MTILILLVKICNITIPKLAKTHLPLEFHVEMTFMHYILQENRWEGIVCKQVYLSFTQ